jgi:hypothetical protein
MKEVDGMILTTTDLMLASQEHEREAEQVNNERQHAAWHDKKVDLLEIINGAFESGYFTGDAYAELWESKNALFRGERKACKYV